MGVGSGAVRAVTDSAEELEAEGVVTASGRGPQVTSPLLRLPFWLVAGCVGECSWLQDGGVVAFIAHGDPVEIPSKEAIELETELRRSCAEQAQAMCDARNRKGACHCSEEILCSTTYRGTHGGPVERTGRRGKLHIWRVECRTAKEGKCIP